MLNNLIYNFVKFLLRFLCICLFKLRGIRRERFPKDEGILIVMNHQSYLDPIFIGAVSPKKTYYFARSNLFEIPLFGDLIRFLGALPIRRGELDISAAKQGINLLKQKKYIVIFPEGTRSKNGEIGKLHTGALVIAKKSGSKVLPCYVNGSFKVLPRNKRFATLHTVKVYIGKSFCLDNNARSSYIEKTLLDKFTELKSMRGGS